MPSNPGSEVLRIHRRQIGKQSLEVIGKHPQDKGVFRRGFDVSVLPVVAVEVRIELNEVIEGAVNAGLRCTSFAEVDDLAVVFDIGGIL